MSKYTFSLLSVIAAITLSAPAMAQLPPNKHKPVLMQQKDSLQQFITTREPDYEVLKDPNNDRVVFKGLFAYTDMIDEPSFSWLTTGIDEYKPDAASLQYLRQHIGKYKLAIYLGTWCGDSKDLVPKLFRVLQDLNIRYDELMMVGMDREKTTLTKEGKKLVKKFKIKLLPTFVLIDEQGHEAGRIEESVNKSIEADLAEIIKQRSATN